MMNKKLGRFKQWAGEVMGGAEKTIVSDEIKDLELEMALRFEGIEKLNKSMAFYVKSISRRDDADGSGKVIPIGQLGATMVQHGEQFREDSEYGQCLIQHGYANQEIAAEQDRFLGRAQAGWADCLGRSMAQMKEYQASRRKLDQRRLAYDASIARSNKGNHDNFKAEEEVRAQKAKFEETTEDVIRRMQEIREGEAGSIAALTDFLDAQLEYHDRCRELLLSTRAQWAGQSAGPVAPALRTRSNTLRSQPDRAEPVQVQVPVQPVGQMMRSNTGLGGASPLRPEMNRASSFRQPAAAETPTAGGSRIFRSGSFLRSGMNGSAPPSRSETPRSFIGGGALPRAMTELTLSSRSSSGQLGENAEPYGGHSAASSSAGYRSDRTYESPTGELPGPISATATGGGGGRCGRNGPPPAPPPSRVKKGPPPPPPPKKNMAALLARGE